jgi:RNA polymerase sigma factor (sigma-70 family)
MNMPPAISRTATLELILALRAAATPEDVERLERKLMEGNLRFCAYHARRYKQADIELDDLIAVAAAALLDAVRNFNPDKSNHFAAYARRCIRRDLAVAVRRQGSPVRLPREPRRGERENGRESVGAPSVLRMDALRGQVRDTQPHRQNTEPEAEESFGQMTSSGTTFGSASGHSLVTEDPTDALLTKIDAERIAIHVGSLPEREASIVRMRFGLDGVAPHELAEIGAVLNISKQRVQVILDRALATLRQSLQVAA